MFNTSHFFNTNPFNRNVFFELLASAILSGKGNVSARTVVEFASKANLSAEGGWLFIISKDAGASLSGEGDIYAKIQRIRHVSSLFSGEGTLVSNEKKTEVKVFDFTGMLAQGDEIVINMDIMTVTRNGENAVSYFEGDWFHLLPGKNEITYQDSDGNREVLLVFRHRNRWS